MTTATAIPAGVIPPPESFSELFGVSAAVRGFVGRAVLEVDDALIVVVVGVDEVNELEPAEEVVVADDNEDEDDSDLVDVRTAGSGIVVTFSSSSSSTSSSSSFESGGLLGVAELWSESVGVGVDFMLKTLETKLS